MNSAIRKFSPAHIKFLLKQGIAGKTHPSWKVLRMSYTIHRITRERGTGGNLDDNYNLLGCPRSWRYLFSVFKHSEIFSIVPSQWGFFWVIHWLVVYQIPGCMILTSCLPELLILASSNKICCMVVPSDSSLAPLFLSQEIHVYRSTVQCY